MNIYIFKQRKADFTSYIHRYIHTQTKNMDVFMIWQVSQNSGFTVSEAEDFYSERLLIISIYASIRHKFSKG